MVLCSIDTSQNYAKIQKMQRCPYPRCKDARIQDAEMPTSFYLPEFGQDAQIYGRKLSCLEYKLSAVESRGDTAIPFHAGFLLN